MSITTTGSFFANASFTSREENREKIAASFAKLNKQGLFSMSMEQAPSKFYTIIAGRYVSISQSEAKYVRGDVYEEKFVTVTMEGTAPGIPGFSIVGRVVDQDGIRQVTAFDSSISMEAFHSGALECKHCNTKHRRVSTYAFRNDTTNELFQVGNSCIDHYTGTSGDITKILLKAFGLVELYAYNEGDEEECGGFKRPMFFSTDILAYAFCVADYDGGYRNRKYDGICTRDGVCDILACKDNIVKPFGMSKHEILDKYFARVADLLGMVEAAEIPVGEFSDYMFNIKQLCGADNISYKQIGMLVSAVAMWYRAEQKKNVPAFVEEYIDEDKIQNVTLVVTSHRYMENYNAMLVTCTTPDNKRVSFWDNKGETWEAGKQLKVKSAKVKDRREYKGQKTTTINYIKYQ
jgi:hypothetical protein